MAGQVYLGANTASARLLFLLLIIMAPLRVVNLAPINFGTFSVIADGKGIVAPPIRSPTLIAGAAMPADEAGLIYSLIN